MTTAKTTKTTCLSSRKNGRVWKCGLTVMAISSIAVLAWIKTSPTQVAIQFSKETTFVTEPVTQNGQYIDYVSLLPSVLIEDDPRDDSWTAIVFHDASRSSVLALKQAGNTRYNDPQDLSPDAGVKEASKEELEVFYSRIAARMNSPFTVTDDQRIAGVVDSNELWYQQILQTQPDPVCVAASASSVSGRTLFYEIGLPLTETHFAIANAFQLRAMHAIGQGDFQKTLECQRILSKCVRREAQLPFYLSDGVSLDLKKQLTHVTLVALMSSTAFSEAQIDQLIAEVPHRVVDRDHELFRVSRFFYLDTVQNSHETSFQDLLYLKDPTIWPTLTNPKSGPMTAFYNGGFTELTRWHGNNYVQVSIDCNEVMRAINSVHDQFESTLDSPFTTQLNQIKAIQASYAEKVDAMNQPLGQYSKDELTELTTSILCSDVQPFPELAAADTILHRFLHLVTGIHRFKKATGFYPETLEQLASRKFSSNLPHHTFTDAFSNEPLHYRRTQQGFVLSSVGENLVDDSGLVTTFADIPDRTDDFVFAWPLN